MISGLVISPNEIIHLIVTIKTLIFQRVDRSGFRNAGRGRFPQTGKASTFRANDILS